MISIMATKGLSVGDNDSHKFDFIRICESVDVDVLPSYSGGGVYFLYAREQDAWKSGEEWLHVTPVSLSNTNGKSSSDIRLFD
jgi:hypothetical protein